MPFHGKVVLITGAGGGIGGATAKHFAKLGATLALTDINTHALQQVSTECQKISTKSIFSHMADLTNESQTEKLIELVIKHFNCLDVLVNNAGAVVFGSIENTTLKAYDKMFDLNVRAVYHLTMLAVPYLIATKGCIVNTSSRNGRCGSTGNLAYSMSKSAIDQFTRSVALELAPKGVRVNSVNPGAILTDILIHAGMDEVTAAKHMTGLEDLYLLGRIGTAEEVAKCIVFLASEDASFTAGNNFQIDGGRKPSD